MFTLGSTPSLYSCFTNILDIDTTDVLFLVVLIGMASLNWCVQEPKRDRWRTNIKAFFERTDLVVSKPVDD